MFPETEKSLQKEDDVVQPTSIETTSTMNCDQEKEQEFTVVAEIPPVVELQPNYIPPDPFEVTLPRDWSRHGERDQEILFVKLIVQLTRVINEKTLRILGDTVDYFVRGEICYPYHLACTFRTIEELNDIVKNFDESDICPGFTNKELAVTNCSSLEGVNSPHSLRYKSCEVLVVNGQVKCSSCKYFDVLKRRKVARQTSSCATMKLSLLRSRTEVRNEIKKNKRHNSKILVYLNTL